MDTNNAVITKAGIKRPLLSVSDILSSTKSGTEILKYYEKNQILQEEHRTLLISTITQYLDLNGCEVSLSNCAELEKQICTIFPTEELVIISIHKITKHLLIIIIFSPFIQTEKGEKYIINWRI